MWPAVRGGVAALGGFWRRSVTHAAAREAAAEAAAAPGAAGTGWGARAPPVAGRLPHSLPRSLSDPRRGRARPSAVEKPTTDRGSHGAGARSAKGWGRWVQACAAGGARPSALGGPGPYEIRL